MATQNNSAASSTSIEKAAKSLMHKRDVHEGILNMIEMAFRDYVPYHACATHTLPGHMPLDVIIRDAEGKIVRQLS